MFERFTAEARNTVVGAQEHAVRRKDTTVAPMHLLLALTQGSLSSLLTSYGIDTATIDHLAPGSKSRAIDDDTALRSIGVDLHAIRESIESAFGPGALDVGPRTRSPWAALKHSKDRGHKGFSANAKKVLELSLRETIRLNARAIGSESVLLGLLCAEDPEVTDILKRMAVDQHELRTDLELRISQAA